MLYDYESVWEQGRDSDTHTHVYVDEKGAEALFTPRFLN